LSSRITTENIDQMHASTTNIFDIDFLTHIHDLPAFQFAGPKTINVAANPKDFLRSMMRLKDGIAMAYPQVKGLIDAIMTEMERTCDIQHGFFILR
jgi:hypothetical protein